MFAVNKPSLTNSIVNVVMVSYYYMDEMIIKCVIPTTSENADFLARNNNRLLGDPSSPERVIDFEKCIGLPFSYFGFESMCTIMYNQS